MEVGSRFTHGKETRCPLREKLGEPWSQSGLFGEDKVSCPYRDPDPGPSIPWRSRYTDYVIPAQSATQALYKYVF